MKRVKIQTTRSVLPAIPELERKETTLYYLIIGEGVNKVIINVGDKTYKSVQHVLDETVEEPVTRAIIDEGLPKAKK
nr:MAG: hypothetical protein [Microviridae sp.]